MVVIETNLLDNFVIEMLLLQFFMALVIIANCININKLISKINLFMLIICFMYRAGITGKRNDLVIPITLIVVCLLTMKKIKLKFVKKVIPYIGILYVVTSLIIFNASERFDLNSDYMKSYLSNRFDISDFALTYFEKSKSNDINKYLIKDGIINSIPEVFMKNKDDLYMNYYEVSNMNIGLSKTIDYGDTIISMACQVWPGVGFIFILFLFYIIMDIINKIFLKLDDLGILIIFLNLGIILNIELTVDGFLAGLRNMLLISIITWIIYKIIKLKRMIKY
ncbi:MAG: hypothetical protein SOT71_09610 [Romboutsia timonensis]|uniref:hypothetical protein n=1 Tax=Romboutsia timonensis TaxID=1776391 RepID=UPI002A765967|nr:hypothetical protein [Romboutsia timonensis]MDY2882893.1 hypothetical protein [Romboutsia timonensis]